jgi:hypothetical protein
MQIAKIAVIAVETNQLLTRLQTDYSYLNKKSTTSAQNQALRHASDVAT